MGRKQVIMIWYHGIRDGRTGIVVLGTIPPGQTSRYYECTQASTRVAACEVRTCRRGRRQWDRILAALAGLKLCVHTQVQYCTVLYCLPVCLSCAVHTEKVGPHIFILSKPCPIHHLLITISRTNIINSG